MEGHESEVKCCAFSISGHYLATCSRDKTVWIWKSLLKIESKIKLFIAGDDEGDDYEVLSILQQHTGDVKFTIWHPREDVCNLFNKIIF